MDLMFFLVVLVITFTQSVARPVNTNKLVNDNGEARRTEEPYGTQLNGITEKAPAWPQAQRQNEEMFILPKKLSAYNKIIVRGELRNRPENLIIGLMTGNDSPDYANIACQLNINYLENVDTMTINTIENGNSDEIAKEKTSNYFYPDENTFEVTFLMRENNNITAFVGTWITHNKLKHNTEDIRFLSVSGDVGKVTQLNFEFDSQLQ